MTREPAYDTARGLAALGCTMGCGGEAVEASTSEVQRDLTTCHPSSLERTLLEAFHWRRQEGMEALTAIPGHFGSSRTEPAGGASTAVVLRSASLKVPGMAAGNSSPYDPTRGLHEDEPPPIQAGLTSA